MIFAHYLLIIIIRFVIQAHQLHIVAYNRTKRQIFYLSFYLSFI